MKLLADQGIYSSSARREVQGQADPARRVGPAPSQGGRFGQRYGEALVIGLSGSGLPQTRSPRSSPPPSTAAGASVHRPSQETYKPLVAHSSQSTPNATQCPQDPSTKSSIASNKSSADTSTTEHTPTTTNVGLQRATPQHALRRRAHNNPAPRARSPQEAQRGLHSAHTLKGQGLERAAVQGPTRDILICSPSSLLATVADTND